MSVAILDGSDGAALCCTTTQWAFGPVFCSREHAADFCRWLRDREWGVDDPAPIVVGVNFLPRQDPRSFADHHLERLHAVWRDERCDEDGDLLPLLEPRPVG